MVFGLVVYLMVVVLEIAVSGVASLGMVLLGVVVVVMGIVCSTLVFLGVGSLSVVVRVVDDGSSVEIRSELSERISVPLRYHVRLMTGGFLQVFLSFGYSKVQMKTNDSPSHFSTAGP